MIMTKRLDTGSPWPLNNGGRRKLRQRQDGALLLTQIVRASTAAPTYFAPEEIAIHARDGSVVDGVFVDGGVTPFNDPALQLLMLAALQGHGFRWPTGKDRLLIVSVGTGQYKQPRSAKAVLAIPTAMQGIAALQSLMDDCERMNRAQLQWLTNCLTPWIIDRAVGDMKLDSQSGPQLATYVRYNAILEQAWLKTELGVDLAADKLEQIRKMDDPSNMDDLAGPRAEGRREADQARTPAGDLRPRQDAGLRPQAEQWHARVELPGAPQGRPIQRPHDRRPRPREAALSARQGAGRRAGDRRRFGGPPCRPG